MRRGSKPRQRNALAALLDFAARPTRANTDIPRCTERLVCEDDLEALLRAAYAAINARSRARRSSSETTYACVPNSLEHERNAAADLHHAALVEAVLAPGNA